VTSTDTVTNQNPPNGYGDGSQNGLTINVVTGASVTATGPAGEGITVNTNNTIVNAGTVQGANIGIGGRDNLTAINSGQVSGPSMGIAGTGLLTVINSGQISGTTFQGIFGSSVSNVTNNAGGTVTGPTAMLLGGGSSVLNAGTITGTGGTAIFFLGSGSTLTLAPTSVINGNVLGAGPNTFQLTGPGSGTFDLSTIGPGQQYQGFGTFNVIGGAWTASNTFAQTGGSGPSKPARR
jgi:hypothetical protein